MLKRFSPYPLWILLSLPPLLWMYLAQTSSDPKILDFLIHITGEWSARVLIITLMVTPLVLIFRQSRIVAWLRRNRRYLGVAAFAYATLHTVFYVADAPTIDRILTDLPKIYIWTGWVAFIIFILLAVTSMDYFQRIMGPYWKTLQRWTYVAAVFTLVHWAALHEWDGLAPALVHFMPLIALETYRVWYWYLRPRHKAA